MRFKNTDLSLLLVRLALAAVFIAHGWQKFQAMDGTIAFFGGLGFDSYMAYVVAVVELGAGVLMLLGLWARLAGLLVAAVMVGAIYLVKYKVGFVGGYEFDVTLLAAGLAIFFAGPGKYGLRFGRGDAS